MGAIAQVLPTFADIALEAQIIVEAKGQGQHERSGGLRRVEFIKKSKPLETLDFKGL